MKIEEILQIETPEGIIDKLKEKSVSIPEWKDLEKQYKQSLHAVNDKTIYPDVVDSGKTEKVTRISLGFQKLATKRMSELVFGIPVKRIYQPENEKQKEIAKVIEKIFDKNRINSSNISRSKMLFASCEIASLWYAVEEKNSLYGVNSSIKLKHKSYSPFQGDTIYPLFDKNDDLIALSFEYEVLKGDKEKVKHFDTFTKDFIIYYENKESGWVETSKKTNLLKKIPAVYLNRTEPIWEDVSPIIEEVEWALSRNGNYLRKNAKPVFAMYSDESIAVGTEKPEDTEFRNIMQLPQGGKAEYVTWEAANETLKFHVQEAKALCFTQLQLPDLSHENMKATPMSGESRKQMFIDAHLKVMDESGPILEFLDREISVIKQFVKAIVPNSDADIDALQVENVITPYSILDDKETVTTLMAATGGNQIMSQRQAIEHLGWSGDVDETLKQIKEEAAANSVELAI